MRRQGDAIISANRDAQNARSLQSFGLIEKPVQLPKLLGMIMQVDHAAF